MPSCLIGITACLDEGKRWRPGRDYIYLARAYGKAIAAAGATPVLLTLDTPVSVVERLQGVVISGGDDLPRRFNAPALATLGLSESPSRIEWERRLLDGCLGTKPVLGICYGMQLINLHLGGSLLRDVKTEVPGAVDHGGSGRSTCHQVEQVTSSAWLAKLPSRFECNSCHGQAIDTLAPDLVPLARASDGVLEAFQGDQLCGIEWHPETDGTGPAVYGAFVAACR